jgi:hypothetical protein
MNQAHSSMKIFRDYFFAALTVLLTFGLLELGLRIYGVKFEASLYQTDPILYNVYRPNAEGWTVSEAENYLKINSLGMRDHERTIQPSNGVIRLAFLGDSMIAALQVPSENTMTQTLERGLSQTAVNNASRKVEVLNFAVGGYALYQMYLMLENKVWDFKPDIVAICLSGMTVPNSYRPIKSLDNLPFSTLDDEGRLMPDSGNTPPVVTAQSLYWKRVFGDLYNRSRLLQLMRTAQQAKWHNLLALGKSPREAAPSEGPAEFMRVWPYKAPETQELTKAWNISEAILAKMIESARQHDTEFWIIQIGHEIEEDPRDSKRKRFLDINHLTDFSYATNRYAEFANSHGVNFLYLSPAMLQYSKEHDNAPLRGFSNTNLYKGHWNVSGNIVAAEIIQKQLLSQSALFKKQKTGGKDG